MPSENTKEETAGKRGKSHVNIHAESHMIGALSLVNDVCYCEEKRKSCAVS